MWVNFTVRSVKPSVRWMERWESEGGRKDCKLGASRMLKARAGRWETLAEAGWYTDRLINTSACTEAYICTYAQGTMSTGRQVCTEMQTQTQKTGYMCKQSQHQSLYERSKSILAVTSFYAIPQHSYAIPTSHLHIKQGSHSHALTNDFWMLLALSLYNCTWDLCSSSS